MRLLVTGGAGFIGSNFVQYLLDKYSDYKITVVDVLTYAGDRARLAEVEGKIKFYEADISDYSAMDQIMSGSDVVVNFAAHSHVDRSIADPGPFMQTNVIGTDVLARVATAHKVKRFHHVSTDEVFGTLGPNSSEKFNEKTPYSPRSPYAASKAASDHIIRAYGHTYGLPYTITNSSNNYGPYDSPARIVPLFITNAIEDKPLPLYGKGQAVRDYLYVYDHCTAIDLVIHKGQDGETYCVGGGTQKNGTEVAEAILEKLGKPKELMQFVKDRPGHDMRYDIDSKLIQKKLGWQQSVSFEDGLAKTVEWYKAHPDWWQPYKKRLNLTYNRSSYNAKQY